MAPPEPIQRAIVVTSPNGVKVDTELRVTDWPEATRTARAGKRLALWWLAAVVAAIVPPHIPWFTICFLGGPIAAILAMRQRGLIHTQTVECPDCKTPANLDEQPEAWPVGARCGECRSVFWLDRRK